MIPEPEELEGRPIGKSRSGFQVAPLAAADWRADSCLNKRRRQDRKRKRTHQITPQISALQSLDFVEFDAPLFELCARGPPPVGEWAFNESRGYWQWRWR
jgi:hypothetical protein